MIVWFKHLPEISMDTAEWKPVITNSWFRTHFMKFVYTLQVLFLLSSYFLSLSIPTVYLVLIAISVFIVHEIIHILVVYKKGDISLTFSQFFFWLHTNATLSKSRFWWFMTLPFILLTALPLIVSFFVPSDLRGIFLFISWFNAIVSASDLFNSVLIALKLRGSEFCRGGYRVQPTKRAR
ncbi:DUF3267 domain-containing protein [Alkalihalobacillus sp. LMS6]|uniref:DUF3267 domain-containing protein n=1 Tax=Alkalihalobacillus sp. LMS6 TaxID=2924034 RepID=UPI0020D058A3|nr:DUF3267 domain-containing protein [Alkalihalobacillus sp. LMS6]UTR07727.1 DUF3267 domain-containing protein [Alkalihalobacillus sp. LMS6]